MKNVRVLFLLLFFSFFLVALAFGRSQRVRTSSKETGIEVAEVQSLKPIAGTLTPSFGGPNSYGYTWLDSDTAGGPLYNWIEISDIGTKIQDSEWKAPNTWKRDDGTAGPFALGFQFAYNDTTFDSIYVGTNGILSFTESDLTRDGYFYDGWIPYLRFPDALAVFYYDLNLDVGTYGAGEVYYWTNSTDSFIVEYKNVKPFVSPATIDTLNFQVILVQTATDSSITYQYKTVATPTSRNGNEPVRADSSALIGIQDRTRYFGLKYFAAGIEGYENLPKAGLAVKFEKTSSFAHNVVPAKQVLQYTEDYLYYYPPYHLFYTKEIGDTLTGNSVIIFNAGQNQEDSIPVVCKIYKVENSGGQTFEDSFYTMLDSVVAGDTAQVTFSENWVPTSRGCYLFTYYTALASDDLPEDDTASGYLFAERNELTSPWTETGPTCDGIIEAGEWSDAVSLDISKFAVPQLTYGPLVLVGPHYYQSGAAILYLKNDSSYLYLALDLPGDTSNTMSDWISIDIEDDGDSFFDLDSSEGALVLRNDFEVGNDVLDFLPQMSTYSDSFVTAGNSAAVTTWEFGIQSNAGHQQAEIRIPFGSSPKYNLNSGPEKTIGIWVGAADASDPYVEGGFVYSNQIAYWPWQGIFSYYPQKMAKIDLSAYPTPTDREWTFMVYLDADNSLESSGIKDLNEMEIAGSTNEVNIVVQMDRHSGYDYTNGNWTGTRRFYVTQDSDMDIISSPVIQDLGELNMGDPTTLVDFIDWAISNYPAKSYCLVLWDHGGGWRATEPPGDVNSLAAGHKAHFTVEEAISKRTSMLMFNESLHIDDYPAHPPFGRRNGFKSICVDETNGDVLYNDELQYALGQVSYVDVLGLDACLMGMVETAYELKDHAGYMVASEEIEPNDGWPYDSILTALTTNPTMSAASLGSTVVAKYGAFYGATGMETQSAIDLSKMVALRDSIDNLVAALIAEDSWDYVDTSVKYSEYSLNDFRHKDLYDFGYLVDSLTSDPSVKNSAMGVMAGIDEAVTAQFHGNLHPFFHGLTIYLPRYYDFYTYDLYTSISNIDFPKDSQWDEFLLTFYYRGTIMTDNYEPNNYYSQAYGPLDSGLTYKSYLSADIDWDWYFISFGDTADISINMKVPSDADFDLYLFNGFPTQVDSSKSRGNGLQESINYISAPPGMYYIRVSAYSSSHSSDPYQLTATFSGSRKGSLLISYDDGFPSAGYYMLNAGDALCSYLTAPTYPMKLEKVMYYFTSLDAAGLGGDGSFSVFVMDYYDLVVAPIPVTPTATGWNYLDLSSQNIILNSDFFVGALYDGFNTPAIAIDYPGMGRDFYWVAAQQQWFSGEFTLFIRAEVRYVTTDAHEQGDTVIAFRPSEFLLDQNYPNPFNPTTVISYQLPDPARVKINVYNILGQKINTLVDEVQVDGKHQVIWDGKDQKGRPVGSGIYFYKIVAGDYTCVRKMVMLK